MLACGMDPKGVMAELTGRAAGYSRGKGGSMHMFSREKNFFGGHGIVGAPARIGTGLAFANCYRGDDRVCLTFFGDGAIQPGPGVRELQYGGADEAAGRAISSRTTATAWGPASSARRPRTTCSKNGAPWGIAGEQVDGMDVSPCMRRSRGPLPHAGPGNGPRLVEMLTYRYRGHSMSDPGKYRTRDEIQRMQGGA